MRLRHYIFPALKLLQPPGYCTHSPQAAVVIHVIYFTFVQSVCCLLHPKAT
uniref:Uncharacterized protein n=1 Tax=Arundo donax TaxID=35708 RepID=A0A0A9EQP3_ARUDO